jgi:hypothetical protein
MEGHMTVVIAFFAAQVVLGGLVWMGIRLAGRQPRLDDRLAAITEITHRPTRTEAARKELAWTWNEIKMVTGSLQEARARTADHIPLAGSTTELLGFAILTFLLYEGESAVALLLNLAARFGGMSDLVAGFCSPLAAAALFAALHVILGSAIRSDATDRRPRVLRRARHGAVAGGAAVIIAAWAVLSGRSFTDPQMIEVVASWGLLTLALLLSVAGAFASLVVTTLADDRVEQRRVPRIEAFKTALERHSEAVQRDLDDHETRQANLSSVKGGASAGLTILLAMALGHPAMAQGVADRAPAAHVAAPATPVAALARSACDHLLDVSKSVDPAARQQAVERIAAHLDTLVDALGCDLLRFQAFSGEPLFDVLHETSRLPDVPTIASCEDAASSGQGSAVSQAIERLYPNVKRRHQIDAVERCQAQERQRQDSAQRERQQAIDAARTAWRDVARTPPQGRCTALDITMQRALDRSRHVLVLTDGADTCGGPPRRRPAPLGPGQTLTVVLLPSTGAHASQRSSPHRARLQKMYPGVRILTLGELTPSMLLQALAQAPHSPDDP